MFYLNCIIFFCLGDFYVDSDVIVVNSLENLQPIWTKENLSKKNKF